MKKVILILLLAICFAYSSFATHQRAGEITYRYISGLTYEATIVTYSYAPSTADRNELDIDWGDGRTSTLTRINGPPGYNPANIFCEHLGDTLGNNIKRNEYVGQHTYPAASTYLISLEDPNRNYGILNIPNSVDVPLYIETQLTINPFLGQNSSPQLLLPPIDQGCVGHPFLHNPGAYDPDGDSLSYKMTICRGTGGLFIPGYKLPNLVDQSNTGTFTMNTLTGDILWDSPTMQGEYNIAFLIEEWRSGIRIGYVTRDMQINIVTCTNIPPVIHPPADTCIEAGSTINVKVVATDVDNDIITLTANGGPLVLGTSPATFTQPLDSAGRVTGRFIWNTVCDHIQRQPYQVFFKAIDNGKDVKLYDIKTWNIKVVGPATQNVSAIPLGNSIKVNWSPNICSNIKGYKVYRRNGFYGYVHDYCETGVPSYTGYKLITTLSSAGDTSYTDDNNGIGLVHGVDYCYIITAYYPDNAESYASDEVCTSLKKDVAIITNVSVQITSQNIGQIYLAWSKPTEIDITQAPGPYVYQLFRSGGFTGNNLVLIDSLTNLNDTSYVDNGINTQDGAWSYRIDIINNTPGNRFRIGESQIASSVFLSMQPGDKKLRMFFGFSVPWLNNRYVIYRQNPVTLTFDSIGTSIFPSYVDTTLVNGNTYCYYVKSIGSYSSPGLLEPLINLSQQSCGIPVDNEPPCPALLAVTTNCELSENVLSWAYPDQKCAHDASKILIYYAPLLNSPLVLIDSVPASVGSIFYHSGLASIAGCYSLIVVDSVGNRSIMSDTICVDIDSCTKYSLPNVFTPNGDGKNDIFVPFPPVTSVQEIDLTIFNRWGKEVFSTHDPAIKWDGKNQATNMDCSDGVYYYVCDVYEITLNGNVKRSLQGSIHILR
jgi:gliding motility-associated-like protein